LRNGKRRTYSKLKELRFPGEKRTSNSDARARGNCWALRDEFFELMVWGCSRQRDADRL